MPRSRGGRRLREGHRDRDDDGCRRTARPVRPRRRRGTRRGGAGLRPGVRVGRREGGDLRVPPEAPAEVRGPVTTISTAAARVAELLRTSERAVALTGAGISVPSGIPDFRSPGTGLWENVDPMEVAHIDAWRADPQRFWKFYGHRFQTLEGKQPNGAHRALVELERRGRLDAVITQNIDGLHAAAGTADPIEVHGSVATASCLACGASYPLAETRSRLDADPEGIP